MGTKKTKVLLVTLNPPMDEMGASILLYRQFNSQDDIELFVMTDRHDYDFNAFRGMRVRLPWILERLSKTRLSLFVHDLIHLSRLWHIPKSVFDAARNYDPDVILIGAESPIADLGVALARRLRKPLGGYFMDWATYTLLGHNWVRNRESRRYLKRFKECDLAFVICPEMLERLGYHRNACIYYPARERPKTIPPPNQRKPGESYQLLFAGNLGQWYGRMLARLADVAPFHEEVKLVVAGKHADWSVSQDKLLRESGIYVGFKKGEEYEQLLRDSDCLLICMGFEPEARLIESTSFKSKIVDYMVSGRPIIVWGPEYCTAVRHAKKYGFAETVTVDDPNYVFMKAKDLMNNPKHCSEIQKLSFDFFDKNLNSTVTYRNANRQITELVKRAS